MRQGHSRQTAQCGHAGIVPAGDESFLDELQQLALAHHGVGEVEAVELDLPRAVLAGALTGEQRDQFDARQVHRFSKMLLHDRKKFANFASVLGISSFLHRKIGSFSLQSY